jgi:TonB family protein
MSNVSADSQALPPPSESWLPGPKPPDEGWTQKKFYFVLGVVLVFHVALIFLFGTKKQIVPRTVANVPHLQLSTSADELIALGDPTLFALPNAHDLVTAFWRRPPAVPQPGFKWKEEAPHYLPPAPGDFGAVIGEYVRNSEAGEIPLNFKPEPKLIAPEWAFESTMPAATTNQITGELAQRRLLTADELQSLPSLPLNDVIAPTTVQALVDTAGNVASTVVLESSGNGAADQRALQVARNLRFAPAPRLTFGEIIFTWHTVPLTTTNEPSR